MIKYLIFDIEQECDDLISELNNRFKTQFKGLSNSYTEKKSHPQGNKWCCPIDTEDVERIQVEAPELLLGLSKGVEDLTDLDESWVVNIDM